MKNLTALKATNLSFGYHSTTPVLDTVSCSVNAGEMLGIIGPNGAGKSTLLKVLTGFLSPGQGEIHLFEQSLHKLTRRQIAQELAFVQQKTDSGFPFTVLEIVLMGRHPFSGVGSLDTKEDIAIAEASLTALLIRHLAAKNYDSLSGGEQQLVMLSRALAQQPKVFVLDEPISFLDLAHQLQVFQLLKKQCAEGAAVIATFHDLNAAARWCDRLLLLSNGKVAAEGAPEAVIETGIVSKVYSVPVQVQKLNNRVLVDLADE